MGRVVRVFLELFCELFELFSKLFELFGELFELFWLSCVLFEFCIECFALFGALLELFELIGLCCELFELFGELIESCASCSGICSGRSASCSDCLRFVRLFDESFELFWEPFGPFWAL